MARVGSGSTFPGSVSADSNPDQNEVDPHTIFEDLFYTNTGRRFSSLILALPGLSRKYIFNLFIEIKVTLQVRLFNAVENWNT